MVAVFIELMALVSAHTTIIYLDGPAVFTDVYGVQRAAEASLACTEGHPTLRIAPDATLSTLVHELAHAQDCLDDGMLNGSPGTRPDTRPEGVQSYCWDSDAEWYACSVVRRASQ